MPEAINRRCMTPVMEVLDGRPTPTPTGTSSPDPTVPHLDIGGLSPSSGSVPHDCTPERVSPVRSPLLPHNPPSPPQEEGDREVEEEQSEQIYNDPTSIEPQGDVQQQERSPADEETVQTYETSSNDLPADDSLSQEENQLSQCSIKDREELEEKAEGEQVLIGDENEDEEEHPISDIHIDHIQRGNVSQDQPPESECSSYSMHPTELDPSNLNENSPMGEDLSFKRDGSHQPIDPDICEKSVPSIGPMSNIGEHSQHLSESSSHLSNEDIQQQSMQEEHHHHSLQEPHHLEDHHHHLQNQHQHYSEQQQPCHLQEYQHPLLKLPLHLQANSHLQDHAHMREQQGHLHDYDDPHHPLDQRHIQESLGEHPLHQHPTERSPEGYWNMHLGMLSKVKSEAKEWYDSDGMAPDILSSSGILKPTDQHDLYNSYRIPPHHSLGSESPHNASLNGPRPSPIPHGSLPFSQSPDQRQHQQPQHQHYQPYQNHSGMREMPPMSPNYQGHPRSHLQNSQHHGASQIPGAQHLGPQHPGAQHPGLQHPSHHPGSQHLQQQYPGQQYGGQQQLSLQGHHGQQLQSPYTQGLMAPGMGPVGHRGHEGREGREGDPYSFVDEYTGPPPRPVEEILGHTQPKRRGRKPKHIKLMENGGDPLAIAAAQAAHEAKKRKWRQMGPDGKPLPLPVKPRKRIDRFDGISEDELSKKILPDHLGPNLDIIIISKFPFQIGINPGLFAAYKGHHYAGPGNHFCKYAGRNELAQKSISTLDIDGKCLFLSGLIPEPLTSDDDHQLLDHGIGFTNIVARTTRGSSDLTRKEIKEGGQLLLSKLQRYQPRVAVFNGKGIYEIFSGKKEFTFGRQPEKIEGTHTHVWVMPSSSARCAQLPRALDKVPFYTALRKFRDFLKGTIAELTEEEITFSMPKNKHIKLECDKLEGSLGDELSDSFLDDSIKEELDAARFDSELDSEEISRSISQSLYNLSGMTREQLEALDCPTIPIRKKRGRPKKSPEDPNAPPRPKPRSFPTELLLCNGEEPPRKKRGRPKKVLEDGTTPPPKRPGRKPKALKEMLAAQGPMGPQALHQNPHSQLPIGHINGMMSPSGYNSNPVGPPFSPQYGSTQGSVHSVNGPSGPHHGDILSSVHSVGNPNVNHGMSSHQGLSSGHSAMHGSHSTLHSGPGLSLHSVNTALHPPGCPTPNSSNGPHTPVHNSLPVRGPTPQGFGQSPGYSPSPVPNSHHHLGSAYSHPSEKNDLHLEEDGQLGLSPIPASPAMVQPDFEPPTSLPESEPLMGTRDPNRSISSHQEESQLGLLDRQQHTPSIQSQFSNPSTPADDSATPYQNYPSYPPTTSCSPTYSSNVAPSPSYPPRVSHSPSYPPSVSCSPSYTPNNTHSPSYPSNSTHSPSYHQTMAQSPSYPPNATQSPSYPPNSTQSPSYPRNATQSPSFASAVPRSPPYHPPSNQSPSFPPITQSPSYPSNITQSPSYHPNINHSPSYSAITRSPSYPASLTHSPSYPPNSTQSPSYRPATSQSPSYPSAPTHSPSLNKPLAPGVHSPQMTKNDVASKSLSGLESLVDQIPSLSETESGPHSSLPNGPCSNPTTPGPPNVADPFSPSHVPQSSSSYPSFSGGGGSFPSSHYGSPQPSNPYSPQYTSSSTNLSTNFSVSSLANSSLTTSHSYEVGSSNSCTTTTSTSCSSNTPVSSSASSSSFSVSSLTGGSPTPAPSMYSNSSYSPAPTGPSPHSYSDIMGSSILSPTPPMGPSFMGSPSLMGAASSMSSSMGGSMGALPSSMNMSGSQLPYPYPQYGDSGPGGYGGPSHSSFPYSSATPGFHVPAPRFPYPSPYSSGPYSQGYSQNAMLERIKQTGMGMGFGGF